jgi:hypothetical protein
MADIPLNIDVLLAAVFAPILCVIGLWFLQLLLIELQKRTLGKLRHKHDAFCKFTNFIGILFQSVCQALGFTVTHSGIASFQLTVNYGKVEPKRIKTGVFEWVANAFLLLGPFFIPAGLVVLASYFLIGNGFNLPLPVQYTFLESVTHFSESISGFTTSFVNFLIHMDLFNPLHVGFLLLLLFFGLGIRPSYIGEERKTKIDIISDLKNIVDQLIKKPVYLLVFFLGLFIFYYLSLFLHLNWYMMLFCLLGWISITAIIALLLTFFIIALVKSTDYIGAWWKGWPYLTLPVSYSVARYLFTLRPVKEPGSVSLLVMILSTVGVIILLIKYKKTNRFKTGIKMKHRTVEDGKKRTSKK